MENSKKIIFWSLALLVIGGIIFFMSSQSQKKAAYEYSVNTDTQIGSVVTSDTPADTGIEVATGTIQSGEATFAYINELSWNVKRISKKGTYFLKKTGEVLETGDVLRTGWDGLASITFSDNSIVRLNNNSEISFKKLAGNTSEIELKNGEIWARVLKPLYDLSLFTIDTGDLSAWVRGTSVSLVKRAKKTQLEVIDSFAETEDKRGVFVRYMDPSTKKLTEETIKPKKRIIISGDSNIQAVKQDFTLDMVYANEFKRTNTQKDIVLMDMMKKQENIDKNLMAKLTGELDVTLPKKPSELRQFFAENAVRNLVLTSTGVVSSTDIIWATKKEVLISFVRNEMEAEIRALQDGATPATQKSREEKKWEKRKEMLEMIDTIIETRDITPLMQLQDGSKLVRNNGEGAGYMSGKILVNPVSPEQKNTLKEMSASENRPPLDILRKNIQQKQELLIKTGSTGSIAPIGSNSGALTPRSPLDNKPAVPKILPTPPVTSGEARIRLPVPKVPSSNVLQSPTRISTSGEVIIR